jgi:hypothetical protein
MERASNDGPTARDEEAGMQNDVEQQDLRAESTDEGVGGEKKIELTKDELNAMVAANVQKWLQEHPPAPAGSEPSGAVSTYENPPEDGFEGFEHSGQPDGFERVLIQVSEDDLKAGRNKVYDFRRDGWVVEKTFLEGAIVRMKLPKEKLDALRKQRLDQYIAYYRGLRKAAPVNPDTGKVQGSGISVAIEDEGPAMSTEEILNLTRRVG